MATYQPDSWVLVNLNPTDGSPAYRRIFATWRGGFTTGDSWKLSSGNLPSFDTGEFWLVPQSSGSEYRLHKESYGMSFYTEGVLNKLIQDSAEYVIITILTKPENETDFT